MHTVDFKYEAYTHHASREDLQYEIKSDKRDHIPAHKGAALKKITNIKGYSTGKRDRECLTEIVLNTNSSL